MFCVFVFVSSFTEMSGIMLNLNSGELTIHVYYVFVFFILETKKKESSKEFI